MKRVAQGFVVGIAALLIVTALLFAAARFIAMPIGFVAKPLEIWLASISQTRDVKITNPTLYWSHTAGFYALGVGKISLKGQDNALIEVTQAHVIASADAFWGHASLAPEEVEIALLAIIPETPDAPPISLGALPTLSGGGDSVDIAPFLRLVAIREIIIGRERQESLSQSHLLLTREQETLRVTTSLAYRQGGIDSSVDAVAYFKPGEGGHADIALDNINPRDIGRFSRLLAPLQGVQLPVTAQIAVDFDADGLPTKGVANLFVDPGQVLLTAGSLQIDELTVVLDTDFASKRVKFNDVRFNVQGVGGRVSGYADYTQNRNGLIERLDFNLSGQGAQINLPRLFDRQLQIARLNTVFGYDVGRNRLEIDRFTAAHNFGQAELTGAISFVDGQTLFDLTAGFGAMNREAVETLWPLPIAPRTRDWAKRNLIGGKLSDGSFTLQASLDELVNRQRGTPMREEAMHLDLTFDQIGLRYMQAAPPLENTKARLSLRGTSFEVMTEGGQVWLKPNGDPETKQAALQMLAGRLFNPDFRNPDAVSTISLNAKGPVREVMRQLAEKPFQFTRNINFDFERLRGEALADVELRIPILAKPGERQVDYQVKAYGEDLRVTGELGGFTLSKGKANIALDRQALSINGTAAINGVAANIEWQQPLGADGVDKSLLAINGMFSPQNIADLGQVWAATRFTGSMATKVEIAGPVAKPRRITITSDLQQTKFMPRPLAYEKPVGVPANLRAVLDNTAEGKLGSISAKLEIKDEAPIEVSLDFDDDVLVGLKATPLSLGRDNNVRLAISRDGDTTFTSINAKTLDVRHLFTTANRDLDYERQAFSFLPFLGSNAIMEGRIDTLLGANKEEVNGAKMRLIRQNGLHEKFSFDGVFKDGTSVIASLDRTNGARRDFALQTENTGNILRLFDWQKEVYGGALLLQGGLFDSGRNADGKRRDVEGRVTMVGFRARNVPVLASLFSLASLTGIADTLSGDGIKFRKLQSNFYVKDGRLTIEDGRVHGPAVGMTMQGDFDLSSGAVDVGGTLVPAYTINSFLGKIPLIGGILASREGEGLLGIGYRMTGEGGKANVLVNPLSVLTPGVFRRIFELGIGLPDDIDDRIPELPDEDLTE